MRGDHPNPQIEAAAAKAAVLVEALPHIRSLFGKILVVKYGGAAMEDPVLQLNFAQEIVLLRHIGAQPVVVHGGGPQITRMLNSLGIEAKFHEGQRITDHATMEVVDMVLGGRINGQVVQSIVKAGGSAVGLSGRSAGLVEARKLRQPDKGGGLGVDMGLVGEIARVNEGVVTQLLAGGFIPVIAPVGIGEDGETYNINADLMASGIAQALKAHKLILLTDVAGVLDAAGQLIPTLTGDQAEAMIREGTAKGGMIPKIRYALDALAGGVKKTHIIDGRLRHALLLELLTEAGVGTEIVTLE